jgi:hypothetical protein
MNPSIARALPHGWYVNMFRKTHYLIYDNSQIINGIYAFKIHLTQYMRKLDRMTLSQECDDLSTFKEQLIIFLS